MDELFHPITLEWFRSRFPAPTEAQARGWPAIAAGNHTLVSAPTGSGKTLAAFLICIDRLLRSGMQGELPDGAQVVYVSPLKALSSDVHRNLSIPLQEITELARRRGIRVPAIRMALRTGDTPAYERQAMARKPPHIWITTPESLYLLLTSVRSRRGLESVHTLILDEIHAVADDKRGSHLSLSAERLCALARKPVVRIGLSATQRPLEEVARFLVGTANTWDDGNANCTIVDAGQNRLLDLEVEIPSMELGPIATLELWDATVARLATLAREHRTTLVFVNTRRLVERLSHLLSRQMGEESVVAHHGSLSRKMRLQAEDRLKQGEAKVCVATASLELGIDVGCIDLVCQIGSPRSINVLLQRIGRSGHRAGGLAKGRLFPLTRDELIECAALLHAVRRGEMDLLRIPQWPLDILAQQVVAMCAAEDWRVEDLFHTVRRAHPYRDLPREEFDNVVHMLSRGIATRLGYRSSYLHLDGVHGMLRARRGARIAALTSGGAIPDAADYDVVLDPEGARVGSVNEDFAFESMAGDVFLLGNSCWRIRRIEQGRVRVEDARGQAPNIPFWIGEAPSRTVELSSAVSRVRESIEARLGSRTDCLDWLTAEAGLSPAAAEQALAYVAEGVRVLGVVPLEGRVVAERFFDESGGMQLVLHAPFGGRINRAWGLALRKRFCRSFDFELQASASDDGINLSLGPQHSFPLEQIFEFLSSQRLRETLVQALLASPIFTTRWRWTAARSLALLRFAAGRRVPPALQRMRAEDLLSAVFPAQAQCQDNRPGGEIPIPDHPLVFETVRDCLTEALDEEGLRRILQRLERGEIEFRAKDTPRPSVFAHQILNAMPYAFLDDAPLEERRSRAVMLRRALPEQSGDLGRLDPTAIRSASEDAWPAVRDAEELHDLLLGLILFPESETGRLPAPAGTWMQALESDRRAGRLEGSNARYWTAAEKRDMAASALAPGGTAKPPAGYEGAVLAVVRGWMEVSGPLTSDSLAASLGLPRDAVDAALAALEGEGAILRGAFTPSPVREEFCDRRILARIHRATLASLRREIEPVTAAQLLQFLVRWQHVAPSSRLEGEIGLLQVVEQLQGFEAAAIAWESEILPCRIIDYDPGLLDGLSLSGEVIWGRWSARTAQPEAVTRAPGMTRNAALGLGIREDLPWLLDERNVDEGALPAAARDVLRVLGVRGASFFSEIISGTRLLAAEIEDALWQLVAAGLATADSFGALRTLVSGDGRRARDYARRQKYRRRLREGRWSLLDRGGEAPPDTLELKVRQCLRRYGVVLRELLAREAWLPPWRELVGVLRRLEARGEIRGGRFVAGFAGEQFALPEAVDGLRAVRRLAAAGEYVRVGGCDPLNLMGILTPGPRLPALAGNRVIYRDGVPVASVDAGKVRLGPEVPASEDSTLQRLLDPRPF